MGSTRISRFVVVLASRSLRLSGKLLELLAQTAEDAAGIERKPRGPIVVGHAGVSPTRGDDGAPVEGEPARDESAEGASAERESLEGGPAERASVERASVERASVERAPVERASVESDPAEGALAEDRDMLVAESADPGAQDGAGPELHVTEPWKGYRSMRAADVVDRLVVESEAALAVMVLYERSHKNRRTVLAAAERELARRSGA
jgi:hypothetical protein